MQESSLRERYEIVEILGSGSVGELYLANEIETGEAVAIKKYQKNAHNLQSALKEASIIQGMQHPAIVECVDFFYEKSGDLYLIYEYIKGGNLRKALEAQAQLDYSEVARVARDLLQALAYLHLMGVIHCDVKPENILLQPKGAGGFSYKLADFDVALFILEIPDDWNTEGSPAYMAPERFGEAFSFQSDLYSVGVILYELIVGARPFEGSAAQLAIAHQTKEPDLSLIEDVEWRSYIAQFLAKDWTQRMPSAQFALSQLNVLLNTEPNSRGLGAQQDTNAASELQPRVELSYQVYGPMTAGGLEELNEVRIPGGVDWLYVMSLDDVPYLGIVRDGMLDVCHGMTGEIQSYELSWSHYEVQAVNPYTLLYYAKSSLLSFDLKSGKETILFEGLENISGFSYDESRDSLLWTDSRSIFCRKRGKDDFTDIPCLNFGITPHLRFLSHENFFFTSGPMGPALNITDAEGGLKKKFILDSPVLNVSEGVERFFLVSLTQDTTEHYRVHHYSEGRLGEVRDSSNWLQYSLYGHYFICLGEDKVLYSYRTHEDYAKVPLPESVQAFYTSVDNRFLFLAREEEGALVLQGYRNHEGPVN